MHRELIWAFDTARFSVRFYTEEDFALDLSWDDDGTAAAGIESGELVAFCACVEVRLDDNVIGSDYLGGCIYRSAAEFCEGHRDPDPMNRNCSIMRAARGTNVCIGHYFPDMVRAAVAEARAALGNVPYIRAA